MKIFFQVSADHNLDGGLRKDTLFTERVVLYHIAWQKDKLIIGEGMIFDKVQPVELFAFHERFERVFGFKCFKSKSLQYITITQSICRQNKGSVESKSGGTFCNQKAYK